MPFSVEFKTATGDRARLVGDTFMFYACTGKKRPDGGGGPCVMNFFSSLIVDSMPCPLCGQPLKGIIGTFEPMFVEEAPSAPQPKASQTASTVDLKPIHADDLIDDEEGGPV